MTWPTIAVAVMQGFGGLLTWRLLRWATTRGVAFLRALIESA